MTAPHSVEEYAIALREAKGLMSQAAARLGVTHEAVRWRVSKHPTLQQVRNEAREAMTDLAESALYQALQRGDPWSVCFYLKTQGKDRGYVERLEERRSVSGDVRIRIEAISDRSDPAGD